MMPSIRILVVEDEAVVAQDLQTRLTRLGYTVVDTTARGDSAPAVSRDHEPSPVASASDRSFPCPAWKLVAPPRLRPSAASPA